MDGGMEERTVSSTHRVCTKSENGYAAELREKRLVAAT